MLSRFHVSLLTGVFVALLSACASTPQTRLLQESPPEHIRHQVILNDTPFFPQRAYQCGPAALATMLGFHGVNVSPETLANQVYIPRRKGSLQIEMVATARSHGMLAYRLAPELSAILREIDAGNPVLVLQDLSLLLWPQWHYAVVIGYDLEASNLILRSGTQARLKTSFSTFERSWEKADHWAYVLMPPDAVPATAEALDFVKACLDLKQSGQALTALRSGRKKWPTESVVLMALGNAEFTEGNHQMAITAFTQVIEHYPFNATAWNNLAYAFAAVHCKAQALAAIQCAQLIQPNDENFRHSEREIKQMSITGKGRCQQLSCPN